MRIRGCPFRSLCARKTSVPLSYLLLTSWLWPSMEAQRRNFDPSCHSINPYHQLDYQYWTIFSEIRTSLQIFLKAGIYAQAKAFHCRFVNGHAQMKALYIGHSRDLIRWSFTAKHGPFIVGHSAMWFFKSSLNTVGIFYHMWTVFYIADKWASLCWSAHLRNLIVLAVDHFNRLTDQDWWL